MTKELRFRMVALVAAIVTLGQTMFAQTAVPVSPTVYDYRIVNTYPHDHKAFTQGLIYRDGFLIESTGLKGRSTLRKVRLETGEVVQEHRLEPTLFAEGLAFWNDQLVQLTWHAGKAFVYDNGSFELQRIFTYSGEGWGLTTDEHGFILTDGSANLRFLDPQTFQEVRRVTVVDGVRLVRALNEIEFVRGEVFANVWGMNRIARIAPQSGRVVGWIELDGLVPPEYRHNREAVLNGIAYDAAQDRLFVTGKFWPKIYEIKVVSRK